MLPSMCPYLVQSSGGHGADAGANVVRAGHLCWLSAVSVHRCTRSICDDSF